MKMEKEGDKTLEPVSDRLLQYVKDSGKSFHATATRIGCTHTVFSRIQSGRNIPSLGVIVKMLANFPDLSAEWLLRGIGEMLKKEKTDTTTFVEPLKEKYAMKFENDQQTIQRLHEMLSMKDAQIAHQAARIAELEEELSMLRGIEKKENIGG